MSNIAKQKALMEKFSAAGDFVGAKKAAMLALKGAPRDDSIYSELAYYDFQLGNSQDALKWGLKATGINPDSLSALIAVASAYGALDQYEEMRRYGRMALELRDRAAPKLPPDKRPGTPRATGTRKIIAFSLFGKNPKYCETAVINAEAQPTVYPGWTSRFHVDETVPALVKERLKAAGAEVVEVAGLTRHWPGPMWRFAAADDPEASHVIFRDADSIVGEREAGAVREWLESGRPFHVMRDAPTHSSLMLAGMWGVVGGVLPALEDMVGAFLDAWHPKWRQQRVPTKAGTRAFDQRFLANHVWPYARDNMMHHDSVFGFLEHREFPDGPRHRRRNVGNCESNARLQISVEDRDNETVIWRIFSTEGDEERLVCEYDGTPRNGSLWVNVPLAYAYKINEGKMIVRVE